MELAVRHARCQYEDACTQYEAAVCVNFNEVANDVSKLASEMRTIPAMELEDGADSQLSTRRERRVPMRRSHSTPEKLKEVEGWVKSLNPDTCRLLLNILECGMPKRGASRSDGVKAAKSILDKHAQADIYAALLAKVPFCYGWLVDLRDVLPAVADTLKETKPTKPPSINRETAVGAVA